MGAVPLYGIVSNENVKVMVPEKVPLQERQQWTLNSSNILFVSTRFSSEEMHRRRFTKNLKKKSLNMAYSLISIFSPLALSLETIRYKLGHMVAAPVLGLISVHVNTTRGTRWCILIGHFVFKRSQCSVLCCYCCCCLEINPVHGGQSILWNMIRLDYI